MQDGNIAPLEQWTSLHPLAAAVARGETFYPASGGGAGRRSPGLAEALRATNRRWGNRVDGPLDRWLAGADAIVTGQQPGLLGGPLLTLVKACAVAAEVARRRAAGLDAVGFLWLATADDDLPEMGWGRVAAGAELVEFREEGWERGDRVGGRAVLGSATTAYLDTLAGSFPSDHGREAVALARQCYAPGTTLGEASARFYARLLEDLEIVLVDSLEPELALTAAPVTNSALDRLPELWDALSAGSEAIRGESWPVPLRITPGTLPLFRLAGERRERVATARGACPAAVRGEHDEAPERFVPNAWLRPLIQDVALDTAVAVLGGAELAYHVQTAGAREVLGLPRPEWRLRPHVTVVTAAERRLTAQLDVEPGDLLRRSRPRHTLPGAATRQRTGRLRTALAAQLAALGEAQQMELSGLAGDLAATSRKLEGALDWWEQRLDATSRRSDETAAGRWARLQAFLRPRGNPQERQLSVLAPLLKLGTSFPGALAGALDPAHPGMHLLHWGEGESW